LAAKRVICGLGGNLSRETFGIQANAMADLADRRALHWKASAALVDHTECQPHADLGGLRIGVVQQISGIRKDHNIVHVRNADAANRT
jgi:hypothetical protein